MCQQLTSDILYRNAPRKPHLWSEEENRPSSALFKDSQGVSVDRLMGRAEKDAVLRLETVFPDSKAIVKLDVSFCISANTVVFEKPLIDNPYHAEIHKSATDIELTNSQARTLAKNAIIVKKYC